MHIQWLNSYIIFLIDFFAHFIFSKTEIKPQNSETNLYIQQAAKFAWIIFRIDFLHTLFFADDKFRYKFIVQLVTKFVMYVSVDYF